MRPSYIYARVCTFVFIEHIRELIVKLFCLFKIRLGNTTSALFSKGNTLGVYRRIEVSVISLYITNQAIHIQIMLFPNISLDFLFS